MKTVDLVVPCYNEEDGLSLFVEETTKVINTIKGYKFRFILVNDGSKDNTYGVMKELAKKYGNVQYISFSRNFGKEAAMYAGFKYSSADYVVVMDADLQHPPKMIVDMCKAMEDGYDCCAARRTSREGESKMRSFFSRTFYRISNSISEVKMPYNAVDYRMMSRQMVDAIVSLGEVQRFSKGLFSWVGFDTKWLPYENVERTIGTTKWSFWGLFKYAIDGFISFTVSPLRLLSGIGFIFSGVAFIYIVITLIKTLIFGIDVPGYVTTLCAVLLLGGVIELSIGILGEYISRIFMESKNRPIFIVKDSNVGDTADISFENAEEDEKNFANDAKEETKSISEKAAKADLSEDDNEKEEYDFSYFE